MTSFVVKLLMGTITMFLMLTLLWEEIIFCHVQEIKISSFGKSVQDIVKELLLAMKVG